MSENLADQLSEAAAQWARGQHRLVVLAAAFAETAEWAHAGSPTAAHWIAAVADIEVCTAREWIRIGRTLEALPATADAFAADLISYSKVRTLTRIATPDNEKELVAIALSTPAGRLGCALAKWSNQNEHPDEIAERHHQRRSVTHRVEPDGMVVTTVRQPPLAAGRFHAALDTIVMSGRCRQRTSHRSDDASADAWPTLAQQRADALTYLVENGTGEIATEVVVHVRGDGCTLDDGTPISDHGAAGVIPSSLIRVLIHDADGRPVNASGRRRFPTARQRRIVRERDRGCIDCGSTDLLEYDHEPAYEQSGQTVVEELKLRCASCHHRRHGADVSPA